MWLFSVTKSSPILCEPIDCSMPGFLVFHYLLELAQTHVHWVNDAIQPSHPLSPLSPSMFNLSQHQGLFQWVSSSHQVANVLELKLQHQSFQWTFRVDFLRIDLLHVMWYWVTSAFPSSKQHPVSWFPPLAPAPHTWHNFSPGENKAGAGPQLGEPTKEAWPTHWQSDPYQLTWARTDTQQHAFYVLPRETQTWS